MSIDLLYSKNIENGCDDVTNMRLSNLILDTFSRSGCSYTSNVARWAVRPGQAGQEWWNVP